MFIGLFEDKLFEGLGTIKDRRAPIFHFQRILQDRVFQDLFDRFHDDVFNGVRQTGGGGEPNPEAVVYVGESRFRTGGNRRQQTAPLRR